MTKSKFPSEKLDQYMVRFPDGLRDRIKAAAEANKRSMNQEIVATLEEKYPAPLTDGLRLLVQSVVGVVFKELDAGSGQEHLTESVKEVMLNWLNSDDVSDADKEAFKRDNDLRL